VPAPEIAERAGHSVEVLLRVYAKCLDDGQNLVNARIEAALSWADGDRRTSRRCLHTPIEGIVVGDNRGRWFRAPCRHRCALVAVEEGRTLPFRLPAMAGKFFRWRRSDQLPPADPRFRSKQLQPEYDGLLAGRLASESLEAAAKWFAQECAKVGLHLIAAQVGVAGRSAV
jgi:hypothetical protein